MGSVLVLFASKTNKPIYDRVCSELKRLKVEHDLRIFSAHKTPKELESFLNGKEYSVIIAGAGMSAHLAGVVAAKNLCPVIGVPCSDNFGGLDALLSTINMPPGIPVLTVGIDCAEEAARAASKIMKAEKKVYINVKIKHAEKAADMLKKLNVPYEFSYSIHDEGINIRFVELNEIKALKGNGSLIINCPVSESADVKDALKLADIRHGLWTSLNRPDNAAIAAAEIIGNRNELLEYRNEIAAAVLKADREERNG